MFPIKEMAFSPLCSHQKVTTCKPPRSCPLGDFPHHAEGFGMACTRSLTVRKTPAEHISPKELPLPHGVGRKRTQHLSYRPAAPRPVCACRSKSCSQPQAMLHPRGQPRNPESQGKALTSSSSSRTARYRGEALLPCNLCCHLAPLVAIA